MALPATYRTNIITRPNAIDPTNYSSLTGTGGAVSFTNVTTQPNTAVTGYPNSNRATWTTATTAPSGGMIYTEPSGVSVSSTATRVFGMYVYSSIVQNLVLTVNWRDNLNNILLAASGPVVAVPAATWTLLTVTSTPPAGTTNLQATAYVDATGVAWPLNSYLQATGVYCVESGGFFSGATAPNATTFKSYSWTGAANASTSKEDYYGVYVEQVTGAGVTGMPRVNVYAAGFGSSAVTCKIQRSYGPDTWTIPGWRARSVTNSDVTVDWFVPYMGSVKYTLFLNGQSVNSMSITVNSTVGYVCDPLAPDAAMAVNTTLTDVNVLTLGAGSFDGVSFDPVGLTSTPSGGRYPIARVGARETAANVTITLYAHTNAVSDAFVTMMVSAPILLFKPVASWDAPSALMYLSSPVKKIALNRPRGGSVTGWVMTGHLVQAVMIPPQSGSPTYAAVASNLGTVTYATVQTGSGYKRYVDVQANPLGLGA